jgi:hypothetical protein
VDWDQVKIISHRGNLEGRIPDKENHPFFVELAYLEGFDVEIDVWFHQGNYMLGHDCPQHVVPSWWLKHSWLWCHAKNVEAMERMFEDGIHYFWHENDRFTLTSKGIPWCYPENYNKNGIVVSKEPTLPPYSVFGVCTDYPLTLRNLLVESDNNAIRQD